MIKKEILTIEEKAREAKKIYMQEYMRKYRKNNKERIKQDQVKIWAKKYDEMMRL